jgi:hypothetical protein
MGVGKRLKEHALHYAKNDRVCAHSDGEGNERNRGKQGSPAEPAQDLLELVDEHCHDGVPPGTRASNRVSGRLPSESYYAIEPRKVSSTGRNRRILFPTTGSHLMRCSQQRNTRHINLFLTLARLGNVV